ncbi:MAG TPA: SPOR domain-containing protein [Allosphingosinicella sp.]|nr:SPOR domain-containing protein [Allosphingosinicella sp.]
MTDVRADDLEEGDRLPWLEAVDEEDGRDGPSVLKLIVAVLVGLISIGLIVGGLFWLGNRHNGGGGEANVETIKAPPGAYKVKPQNPGGMNVQGEGDTSFAASAGAEPKGRIDASKMPETPVTKGAPAAPPRAQARTAPPAPAARPAAPAPARVAQAAKPQPAPRPAPARPTPKPAPAPAASGQGGGSIQLGAFSSQASAERAWKAMSGRFSYLAPLSHNVIPVSSGGRTLYRLRAGGAGASDVCRRLKVAGETCVTLD